MIAARRGAARVGGDLEGSERAAASRLLKLYVGDDYEKDVLGARGAGWNAVLVGADADAVVATSGKQEFVDLEEQLEHASLEEAFPRPREGRPPATIRTKSTQALLEWLIERYAAEA
jgi:hypothetical protein